MNEYAKAFTAASANPDQNYEIFEQLGDVSANKFIVWYAYQRNSSPILDLLFELAAITFFLASFLVLGNWVWRKNLLSYSNQA